jgi:hypothetical protein
MKKSMQLVTVLVIGAAATGCGTTKVIDGETVRCPNPRATVNNGPGHLEVKEVINVCRGDTIILKFSRNLTNGAAHTREVPNAPISAPWLNRDAPNGADRLEIPVTDAVKTPEGDPGYKYTLTLDGHGSLDPRIVVQ